ncbi:MAG: ATP-binding protein, partial [Acidobacteriota bacterium]|nr:ATP-binding protein [Acidobacteriota bacterium]
MPRLRLPARFESLDPFLAFIADQGEAAGFRSIRRGEVQLVVEEAVVNIIRHAYPGHAGDIELRWEAGSEPGRVVLEIEDEGVPFDLRSAPAPDLRSGIEERPIGGLGIHFIRSL